MSTAELLRQAARALDDGIDPFGGAFLREHDVSLDDCFTLAQNLAIGARMVAKGLDDPRSEAAQVLFMTMAEEVR